MWLVVWSKGSIHYAINVFPGHHATGREQANHKRACENVIKLRSAGMCRLSRGVAGYLGLSLITK